MQKIWSVVDLLCQIQHWWSPVISTMYGLNPERIFGKILYEVEVISHDNYYSQFYHPFCELVQYIPSTDQAILP
jgi:hypothetical protein